MQVFVGSRVFRPVHFHSRVVHGYAFFNEERLYQPEIEAFLFFQQEVGLVAEEAYPEDAPHVVLVVWVVEWHAPALGGGWERAEHEQPGVLRQEGFEWMFFHDAAVVVLCLRWPLCDGPPQWGGRACRRAYS